MSETTMARPGTVETRLRSRAPRMERTGPLGRWPGSWAASYLFFNTYWGLGGREGLAWVLGGDCEVPLFAVWVQEAAIVAGIGVVLGRAGIWRPSFPSWVFSMGMWTMTASFAVVGLQNLLGDNPAQARSCSPR